MDKDTFLSKRDRLERLREIRGKCQAAPCLSYSPGQGVSNPLLDSDKGWASRDMWPEFYLCSTSAVTGSTYKRRAEVRWRTGAMVRRQYPRNWSINCAITRSTARGTPPMSPLFSTVLPTETRDGDEIGAKIQGPTTRVPRIVGADAH